MIFFVYTLSSTELLYTFLYMYIDTSTYPRHDASYYVFCGLYSVAYFISL